MGKLVRVAMLAGLLAMLAVPPVAHAAFPGQNGKIAFAGNGIETIVPDGSSRTVVKSSGSLPVWSPDGTQIVYESAGPPSGIYTMTAAGAPLTQCPCDVFNEFGDGASFGWPTWAPDGYHIAFVRTEVMTDQLAEYVVEGRPGTAGGSVGSFALQPAWLEWGANNIFRWEGDTDGGVDDEIHAGGTTIRSVSNEFGEGLTVSPDGTQIAFGAEHSGGDVAIYRSQSDGSGAVRLSGPAPAKDSMPAWSPDGSKIVFQSKRDGNSELYVMNTDGSNQTRLTNTPSINEGFPDWQPLPNGFPRPKAATPTYVPLVPAFEDCSSANRAHGGGLSYASCSPTQQRSAQATVGTGDANGQPANFTGFVRLGVVLGDVNLTVDLTDVRAKATLADYTGELRMQALVRATDKLNPPPADGPSTGTVQDITFGPPVPCSTTVATNIGSECSLSTTVNALIPNLVVASARSNWQFDQIQLYDGGADGDGDTQGDNTLFAVQGVFVP